MKQQTYEELAVELGVTREMVEDWWGQTDFKQMETITGYCQDDFPPDEGYQDFVDACDEWWENLSWEWKLSVYFEFFE